MSDLISSTKPNIDVAAKEIVTSMQTGQYGVTAAWANVGNGFEITIPKTGRYRVTCQFTPYVSWSTNDENAIIFSLTNNGTHIVGTYGRTHKWVTGGASRVGNLSHVVAPLQSYSAGDVIRLRAYKNNTDAASILYGNTANGWSDGYLQAEMIDFYVPNTPDFTPWQTYTMVIEGSTTNPTKGTMVDDLAAWRRNGANMEITYTYYHNVAGASGSGSYWFNLPPGYSADLTNFSTGAVISNVGNASCYNGSNWYQAHVKIYDATRLVVVYDSPASTVGSAAVGLGSAATIIISFQVSVPILGWS